MWKKSENEPAPARPMSPPPQRPPAEPRSELATIGPSISIKGDLSGEEDLLIQGRIEGKIVLKKHNVTVGKNGRVKADIHGKSIRIEGEVHGSLYGEDDVVIRASGRVEGNLVAPRVTLENGSKFKGSIDMEPAGGQKAAPPKPPERPAKPAEKPATAAAPAAGSPASRLEQPAN